MNAVCPGTVDSPWVRRLVEEVGESLDALRARQPMGGSARPDEIAAAVLYLASRRRGVRDRHRVRDRRRPDRGLSVQALVTTPGKAHSTDVAEVSDPRPGPREVLLRTLEVGVCGTDREISKGCSGSRRTRGPAGARATSCSAWSSATRTGSPRRPGGRDGAPLVRPLRRVRRGRTRRLPHRGLPRARYHRLHGFASELVAESPDHLVAVPARSAAWACWPSRPRSAPGRSATRGDRRAPAVAQPTALVLGTGAIGMLSTSSCASKGFEVWAAGRTRHPTRRHLCRGRAARATVDRRTRDAAELAGEIDGFDVVIEADRRRSGHDRHPRAAGPQRRRVPAGHRRPPARGDAGRTRDRRRHDPAEPRAVGSVNATARLAGGGRAARHARARWATRSRLRRPPRAGRPLRRAFESAASRRRCRFGGGRPALAGSAARRALPARGPPRRRSRAAAPPPSRR